MESATRSLPHWLLPTLLGLVLLAGIWLRWPLPSDAEIKGFDESIYVHYTKVLRHHGLGFFPDLAADYLRVQPGRNAFLPPTRVLFLTATTLWTNISGMPVLESVRAISALASCLILILGAVWAWRLGGPGAALGVAALLACAPTQIHMAHRALIDGFFAFWALFTLWGLWEALRAPERKGWLIVYGAGLTAMVLTKENAAFVFIAICGILLANLWLRFGTASRQLYATTLLAPAIGGLVLIATAGGLDTLLQVYRLNVSKSMVLPYAIGTGDGPWFRYILDLLLVSPVVLLVAVVALGNINDRQPAKLYLSIFLVLTYAIMCQVRYGMNLRYGNMWDLPLRLLVFWQLVYWAANLPARWRNGAVVLAVTLICSLELQQYNRLFVDARIYDPIPAALTSALDLIKSR